MKALWSAFRQEGIAFWLLCAYLMFEYVRPQGLYPVLDFFPWSSATMIATIVAALTSRQVTFVSSPANSLLLLFSVVVLLSSIGAYDPMLSFSQFDVYFLWVVVYALIIHIVTTERRMLLFLLAFVLFNFKMSQFATRAWISIGFGFRDWGSGGAPGWFENAGEFGIEMCVFLPIMFNLALGLRPSLSKRKFLALLGIAGTAIAGIIMSSSRGALFGFAAVILFMIARSKFKTRALIAGIVVAAVVIFAIPPESMQRLSASGDDYTSQRRLTFWKHGVEMTNDHPFLGIGYRNWMPYYRDHFEGQVQPAHNTIIEASSELGYTGLIALMSLFVCTFMLNAQSRALASRAGPAGRLTYYLANGLDGALVGFLVSGFFISALYYPYIWINLAMTVSLKTVAARLPAAATTELQSRFRSSLQPATASGVLQEDFGSPGALPRG